MTSLLLPLGIRSGLRNQAFPDGVLSYNRSVGVNQAIAALLAGAEESPNSTGQCAS